MDLPSIGTLHLGAGSKQLLSCRTLDVSCGGLSVLTQRSMYTNILVNARFRLGGVSAGWLELDARVAHRARHDDTLFRYGLEFLDPSLGARVRLCDFVYASLQRRRKLIAAQLFARRPDAC